MRIPHTLLLVCTLGSISPAALAVERTAPSPETIAMTDKARQLYEEGLAAFKKGKVLEAHASFFGAWSLAPHWQIAANLADVELELGKLREAAEHAAYYQKNAPADRRAKADALLQRATARVGTLEIEVAPPGAEVLVDDAAVGRAPLGGSIFVLAGPHKVTARLAGRPDVAQTVTVEAGARLGVTLKIVAEVAAPPVVPLPVVEKRPVWPAVVSGGLAVVGLAVGAGLTAAANGKSGEAEALDAKLPLSSCSGAPATGRAGDCNALKDALRSQSQLGSAAVAGFIGSGALALVAAGFGVWSVGPKRAAIRVAPLMSAQGGGVVVLGVW